MSCGDFSEVHIWGFHVYKKLVMRPSHYGCIVDKSFFTGSVVSTFGIYKLKHFLELK